MDGVSIDENQLVFMTQDGFIKIVDSKEMKVGRSLRVELFKNCVTSMSMMTETILALASLDGSIHTFDLDYFALKESFQAHDDSVLQLIAMKERVPFGLTSKCLCRSRLTARSSSGSTPLERSTPTVW